MLGLVALLYLGPQAEGFWECGIGQFKAAVGEHMADERCWADGLDDLRSDGTAAAVLLAIAAAFPISTWRNTEST